MEQQHGLLVVDKPSGLSSARCIARLKRLGQKKIGHAGTLDPMAGGVLLVLLGHATKIAGHLLTGGGKTYLATARLGETTDTWDAEGAVTSTADWAGVTDEAVRDIITSWLGESEQPVPPFSAAKHQGQPLYKLARAGRETPQKIKCIHISQADVLQVELPLVRFRITCSSGTYIRSLAHSLGMRLGCGAVLTELVREYSHPFGLGEALPLETFLEDPALVAQRVLPVTRALPHWPAITVDTESEARLRNGMAVSAHCTPNPALCRPEALAVLMAPSGTPLALAEAHEDVRGMEWRVLRGLWN